MDGKNVIIQSQVVKQARQKKEDSHAEPAGIAEKARRTTCSGYPGDTGSPERLPHTGFGESVSFSRHLPRFEDYRDLRPAGGNLPFSAHSVSSSDRRERARETSFVDWHHSALPPITECIPPPEKRRWHFGDSCGTLF